MPVVAEAQRKWWVLLAMGLGGGLIMLDETVVGVALPALQAALGMSTIASHWVISLYMLVFAALAAAGGKLGDVLGFRNTCLLGLGLFGLASLWAGAAQTGTGLLLARAVQGLGAAIIFPSTVAMISIVFPPQERGMALGIMATIGTLFLALGPLVGGVFTEWVSWRWIFWINIPVVAAIGLAILLAWRDPPRQRGGHPFDFTGLLCLVSGIGLLVFGIMQGPAWGWSRGPIPWILAAATGALIALVALERKREAPLISVKLFANGVFSACVSILFVGQFSKIAVVVFAALYLQRELGMSPLQAGLGLLASVVAFPVLSTRVGKYADRHGARRPVIGGMILATGAMAWLGLATDTASYWVLLPGLALWGVGMSCCYSPTLRAMAASVPLQQQGEVGGIGATARLLGGALGMAIGSTLYISSDSFAPVFLVTAALMGAAALQGWLRIHDHQDTP